MQCRQSVRWAQIVGERGRGALKCRWYAWRDKYFFCIFDLYECGSIIFPMRMACFVDERNGQAPCATVGKTVQKVVRRALPRASGYAPRAAKTNGRSLLQLQGMFFLKDR